MLNKKKKRMIKRNLKRVAIVGVPFAILCTITYASITSLSHAGESTYAFEHYYDDPSYSGSGSEYDNINKATGDSGVGNSKDEALEVITNHDNVVMDTNPESMTVLVNKELRLPSDYIPGDLVVPDVSFSFSYYDEKKLMRQEAADALEKLFDGGKAQNIILNGVSAYRSYQRQYDIFTDNVKKQGLEHTTKYSATPGYSEHQTGLAIDVSADSVNNRLDETFGDSTEGKWLAENAHLYGFIIRYPEDKTEITGYSYEPWHIRYVGKPLAKYIYENNLCLEEYFNFEPSMDYSDQISYDNLVDYGIDLADVLEPTKAPTRVPTQAPTKEPDKNTEEDKDTEDDTKDTKDDSMKEPTGKPSGGKGDEDTSGETKDANDGDDGNVTPTKPPKGHGSTPSVTPTPTETITPTPDPDEEITPPPSDMTTDEETP
ncbi:M15 family metallopeptidase [Anaerocolumna sedimenticola]|nr:M15 family metallopeptidase [Anaerocolumna sedimenticola]